MERGMISAPFRPAKPKFELSQKLGILLHHPSPFTNDPLLEKVRGRLAWCLSRSLGAKTYCTHAAGRVDALAILLT